MKRRETFSDRVASFLIGAVTGLLIAWGAMTFLSVDSRPLLIAIIIGSGLFAMLGWNLFWQLFESLPWWWR